MMKSFRTSSQGLKSWYVGFFQLPLLPEVVARRALAKGLAESGLPADRIATYTAAMAEPGALTGALNWYRGIPFSVRTPIGAVRVPTSYIWGRHDFALGRAAAELTASFVTGPYAFIELDSGHWLPETDPVAVANAIGQRVAAP
jgi:pimeloyl-ACP methyl ester carboxylesterase